MSVFGYQYQHKFRALLVAIVPFILFTSSVQAERKTHHSQPSPWSGKLTAGMGQGLGEDSNPTANVSTVLKYTIRNAWYAGLGAAYFHRFTPYENPVPNNDLEDPSLGFGNAGYPISDDPDLKLLGSAKLHLPLSQSSQKSSLRMGYSIGGGIVWTKGPWSTGLTSRLYLFDHEFDTADIAGTTYNNQVASENNLGIGVDLPLKHASVGIDFTTYTARNYFGNTNTDYSLSPSLSYSFTKRLSGTLAYVTADRIVTDNGVFARKNSSIRFDLLALIGGNGE